MENNDKNKIDNDFIIKEINQLLNTYKGTRNYHNFTIKTEFKSPNAKRFIRQISAEILYPYAVSEQFRQYEIPFVLFTIEGHGFMYHQIRKMIGLLIQIQNKFFPKEDIENVFKESKIDIWLAPGAGLFLKEVICK